MAGQGNRLIVKARGGKRKVITETLGFLMGIHERRKEDKDTNGPIILGVSLLHQSRSNLFDYATAESGHATSSTS